MPVFPFRQRRKHGFDDIVDVEYVVYKPDELEKVLSELRGKKIITEIAQCS